MATATYVPIATQTLSTAASSITFSSIPSTYTDLRIVLVATQTGGNSDALATLNGDTGTNYSNTYLRGTGSAAASYSYVNQAHFTLDQNTVSTIPELFTMNIFSYAGASYKTILSTSAEDMNGSGVVSAGVGLWRSTAAVTSVTLTGQYYNWAAGTTATLWGI